MRFLSSIILFSLSITSAHAIHLRKSPRTATSSLSPSSSPTISSQSISSTNSNSNSRTTIQPIPTTIPSISTTTLPLPTIITTASYPKSEENGQAEGFLTAAKATVTSGPEIIIDASGRVLSMVHEAGEDKVRQGEGKWEGKDGEKGKGVGIQVQEKWHLTTFSSCHTFDATFVYCGLHEPVLPGGNEIAAAVRPFGASAGMGRAVMVILGTLVGVDVFLR